MHHENSPQPRSSIEITSVLLGIGSGIMATLIFAAFRQREFDRLINKSRRIAGSAGDFVGNVSDDAHAMTSHMAHAAHDSVRSVGQASKDALEAVRNAL